MNAYAQSVWAHLNRRIDHTPENAFEVRRQLGQHWLECDWPEFFDLLEFVVGLVLPQRGDDRSAGFEQMNELLEQQGCAYRFISERLAPLTNPTEMAEVARAAESAIPAVGSHIRDALKLLPPHDNPNPRISVKEAISAVEAALKNLTGTPSATLTSALPDFERKYGAFHPALRAGLEKLYAYTSDEKGIRHALVDETSNVTVDDARFMIVACSAFANYLVALASRS